MKTPTTIEALDGAIRLLKYLAGGRQYSAAEFHEQVRSFEQARDAQFEQDIKDERNRAAVREHLRRRGERA